jgi:Ca-activated chloride channel family protein
MGMGLACLVVALARPQRVERKEVVDSEGIDIMLVIDSSGSMEAEDYTVAGRRYSRLQIALKVMGEFIQGRPHDRLGLVVFGEQAFTQVPLTLDHDALQRFLQMVQIGMAGPRGTAVGDGLAVACKRLKNLDAPSKVVVLLTDGQNNAGQLKPMEAAQAAAALGIRVYTIGVGSAGGGGGLFGMISGRSDLDERSLKAIAEATGGRYFRAADARALEQVYATIDELEKSTAEVEIFEKTDEVYHSWLGAGLVLLLLQALLGETLLRRLP